VRLGPRAGPAPAGGRTCRRPRTGDGRPSPPRGEGRTASPSTFPDTRRWRCPRCPSPRGQPRPPASRMPCGPGQLRSPRPRCEPDTPGRSGGRGSRRRDTARQSPALRCGHWTRTTRPARRSVRFACARSPRVRARPAKSWRREGAAATAHPEQWLLPGGAGSPAQRHRCEQPGNRSTQASRPQRHPTSRVGREGANPARHPERFITGIGAQPVPAQQIAEQQINVSCTPQIAAQPVRSGTGRRADTRLVTAEFVTEGNDNFPALQATHSSHPYDRKAVYRRQLH
jgi:hypothetical protein